MSNNLITEKNKDIVEMFTSTLSATQEDLIESFTNIYSKDNEKYNEKLIQALSEVFEEFAQMDDVDQDIYLSALLSSLEQEERDPEISKKINKVISKYYDLTVDDVLDDLKDNYNDQELKQIQTRLTNAYEKKKELQEQLVKDKQDLEMHERELDRVVEKEDVKRVRKLIDLCERSIGEAELLIEHSKFIFDNPELSPKELNYGWEDRKRTLAADAQRAKKEPSQRTNVSRTEGFKPMGLAKDYKPMD